MEVVSCVLTDWIGVDMLGDLKVYSVPVDPSVLTVASSFPKSVLFISYFYGVGRIISSNVSFSMSSKSYSLSSESKVSMRLSSVLIM